MLIEITCVSQFNSVACENNFMYRVQYCFSYPCFFNTFPFFSFAMSLPSNITFISMFILTQNLIGTSTRMLLNIACQDQQDNVLSTTVPAAYIHIYMLLTNIYMSKQTYSPPTQMCGLYMKILCCCILHDAWQ